MIIVLPILWALAAIAVHALLWRIIRRPASERPGREVGRIMIWFGIRMIVQLSFFVSGLIFFQKSRRIFVSSWCILYLGLSVYEILRLHQGAKKT